MTIPNDVTDCLDGYLARYPAERIAQIGPATALPESWAHSITALLLNTDFNLERDIAMLGQVDLAIVLDAPTILSSVATRQLLARLRNYSARTIVAAFDIDAARQTDRWSVADFLGLGFRRMPEARKLASRYWVYRYDIDDYKLTPDWLNSRHWANPEQWGRHRW